MHSHHSHSGDYVSHAVDKLEDIIAKVDSMGFTHFCLTEHMPRLSNDFLYPEEIEKGYKKEDLLQNFRNYIEHATRVQKEYNSKSGVKLLVGFEIEGLDDEHISFSDEILSQYPINMTVGSVHYLHKIPIDFSAELWLGARDQSKDKTARGLYKDYFDLQFEVISRLKPNVIGHFDLIRLFEPKDEIDPTTGIKIRDINLEKDWPEVWEGIVKNIKFAVNYGALFELNSAAIRKGWDSPYPKKDISLIIKDNGGRFCLSDDSHGLKQVGLNFHKVRDYVVNELKLLDIYYLDLDKGKTVVKLISIDEFEKSNFWQQYKNLP